MLIHLPVFKYFVLSARTVRKAASEASGRRTRDSRRGINYIDIEIEILSGKEKIEICILAVLSLCVSDDWRTHRAKL